MLRLGIGGGLVVSQPGQAAGLDIVVDDFAGDVRGHQDHVVLGELAFTGDAFHGVHNSFRVERAGGFLQLLVREQFAAGDVHQASLENVGRRFFHRLSLGRFVSGGRLFSGFFRSGRFLGGSGFLFSRFFGFGRRFLGGFFRSGGLFHRFSRGSGFFRSGRFLDRRGSGFRGRRFLDRRGSGFRSRRFLDRRGSGLGSRRFLDWRGSGLSSRRFLDRRRSGLRSRRFLDGRGSRLSGRRFLDGRFFYGGGFLNSFHCLDCFDDVRVVTLGVHADGDAGEQHRQREEQAEIT